MAWLWSSYNEYAKYVQPVMIKGPGPLRRTLHDTWYETEQRHGGAIRKLEAALQALVDLGFNGRRETRLPGDKSLLDPACQVVLELVYAGEELLMLDKRLAKSRASYGFLHQHDIVEHWERYAATDRIFREIDQLVKDTHELLQGLYELHKDDDSFLLDELDLPQELEADFRLARNLFSVGFDDLGVFVAGRGFEGVLRRIAQVRKLSLRSKGGATPAYELDLHDLIELLSKVRWKKTGERLISRDTRVLLQYIRTLRNNAAHPELGGARAGFTSRQTAALIADAANALWKEVSASRAHFDTTVIDKVW